MASIITLIIIFLFSFGCSDTNEPCHKNNTNTISLKLAPALLSTPTYNDNARSTSSSKANENLILSADIFIGLYGPDGNLVENIIPEIQSSNELTEPETAITLSLFLSDTLSESIYTLAVTANTSGYSDEGDIDTSSLSTLRNSLLHYPPLSDGDCIIPMYGETVIDLSEGHTFPNDISVELVRALAKIEIKDSLPDGWEISGASLPSYSTTCSIHNGEIYTENIRTDAPLLFSYDPEEHLFYIYVPERSLSPQPESADRRIDLRIRRQEEDGYDERQCPLYLARYNDGTPSTSDSPEWERLSRNHLYRFSVTSFTPKPEIQSVIRIIWHTSKNGKFSNSRINFRKLDSDNNTQPVLGWTNRIATSYDFEHHPSDSGDCLYFELNLANYGLDTATTLYQLFPYSPDTDMDNSLSSIIKDDIVKLENIGNISYCWLNRPMITPGTAIAGIEDNAICRIYWRTTAPSPCIYINDGKSFAAKSDERGYYYFDFNLKENISNRGFRYGIESAGKEILSGNFTIDDIFLQTTAGMELYIYYVN